MNASDDELEEDDEFEDEYGAYSPSPQKKKPRKKPGKRGEEKGRDALRRENKMAKDAAKEAGLNKEQARLLHREIVWSGFDLSTNIRNRKIHKNGDVLTWISVL